MDKLKMHSVNKVDENINKIGALFPNALTEVIKGYKEDGTAIIEQAIDFDVLRQELSNVVVEGSEERYQFTWPDKKKSVLLGNAPIAKTLRPCREESVDFDSTENLYIEGDNLDALKLLQETYLGKVKMIYIDPPYNTGNDFIYEDDFSQNTDDYLAHSGQFDEEGNRMVQNTESNGRFHTDWLNMIYPRLKLAKDLLTDDGVIFISIDNNEAANIKKICDEIFGHSNFIEQIPWIKRVSPANDSQWYSGDHEFILIYAKYKNNWFPNRTQRTAEHDKYYKNTDNDPRGPWNSAAYTCNKSRSERPNLYYAIVNPNTGEEIYPNENAVWAYSKQTHEKNDKDGLLYWGSDGCSKSPRRKQFLTEAKDVVARSFWHYTEVGSTQTATTDLRSLFNGASFSYPKPVSLLKKIIYQTTRPDQNDIILDFFSGSATTAHSAMQLNAEDSGNRKYIMVQLPEETDEKSEAYKASYKNICEIGKERIRRAGKKVRNDHSEASDKLDIGFRVLKVDSTNMQDVYYNPAEYSQGNLFGLEDNIKPDRTPEDLLFQVMLDLGVLLSSKIEEIPIGDKKVFSVADGYLMACFDTSITSEIITEIAKKKPYYAVFRDNGMASDSVATNFEQIFTTYSPTTVRKVL